MAKASADCPPASLPAEHPLFILYTSGTTGKPKGIVHTTGGYLLGAHLTTKYVFDLRDDDIFWCTADIGWVTGHSYVVYGPLSNGATTRDVRGRARPPGPGSLLVDHRAAQGHDLLHGADGDPRLHALGRRVPEEARPVVAAPARHRRRADQPRGVDVVPRGHRRRALPDRRHLVADRDRRDHDDAAARASRRPSRAAARGRSSASTPHVVKRDGTPCAPERGRLPRDQEAVAVDAAHDLRRPRALREAVLVARSRASTSPATARATTRTATSGSWAASTTCSTSPATAWAPRRSRARWSRTPASPRRRSSGRPDELKGQAIVAFVTPQGGRRRRRPR